MDKITSSTTHGKLYQDALKLEGRYHGLVFELRRLTREYNNSREVAPILDKLEQLLEKYGVPDEPVEI